LGFYFFGVFGPFWEGFAAFRGLGPFVKLFWGGKVFSPPGAIYPPKKPPGSSFSKKKKSVLVERVIVFVFTGGGKLGSEKINAGFFFAFGGLG